MGYTHTAFDDTMATSNSSHSTYMYSRILSLREGPGIPSLWGGRIPGPSLGGGNEDSQLTRPFPIHLRKLAGL